MHYKGGSTTGKEDEKLGRVGSVREGKEGWGGSGEGSEENQFEKKFAKNSSKKILRSPLPTHLPAALMICLSTSREPILILSCVFSSFCKRNPTILSENAFAEKENKQ
jgi:hypothetical protein